MTGSNLPVFASYFPPPDFMRLPLCALGLLVTVLGAVPAMSQDLPRRPEIRKLGTVDLDLRETSPFVFKRKAYRLEWDRKGSYLRIVDHATNKEVSHFGAHSSYPCAYADGDTVYIFGTREDGREIASTVSVFTSKDLLHWEEQVGFHDPGYNVSHPSVCKADGRYVMSIEVKTGSKDANRSFVARFLESKDLLHWNAMPSECSYGFGGKSRSAHLLRWGNGWYYLFSTAGGDTSDNVLLVDRSRDLQEWEESPFNPVMAASVQDKQILNTQLTPEQQAKVSAAHDSDNSDIDFCEFQGKLLIDYCWGNQVSTECVAEAQYDGTTGQFLEAWFPNAADWAGINIKQPLSTFAAHRKQYGHVLSATGAIVTTSSLFRGSEESNQALLRGDFSAPFAFHTLAEANPWVTIDLWRKAVITGVLVRNRTDSSKDRATGLRLQVSDDGENWKEVWTAAKVESVWEISLLEKNISARFLRFDTRPVPAVHLHLQHVEVWGREQ